MVLGCHNVVMFNHSTLLLSYLLLYGYDVTGDLYTQRLIAMGICAAATMIVYYRNHHKKVGADGVIAVGQGLNRGLHADKPGGLFCHLLGDLRVAQSDLLQHRARHPGEMLLHTANAGTALVGSRIKSKVAIVFDWENRMALKTFVGFNNIHR